MVGISSGHIKTGGYSKSYNGAIRMQENQYKVELKLRLIYITKRVGHRLDNNFYNIYQIWSQFAIFYSCVFSNRNNYPQKFQNSKCLIYF